ncbi:MAG TPA: hypothetical protein PKV75_09100 [Desulfobacterales bacterium]|nr:hypothetical protein [Desulfobacterales bacterium]
MNLKEIIDKCGGLSIREKRCAMEDYVEIVFYNKEIEEWKKIFSGILGPAKKPAGVKPAVDDLNLTRDSGGIRLEQILYGKVFQDVIVIAMFCPWKDDLHTTLKMTLLKN